MTTKYWVKLYIEILDDPKMGRLPNHLWRRAVELFLLAGRKGNDGALPPVEEMAWTLRLDIDKVLEDLHDLAEVGVVHEAEPGVWFVTHFKDRQTSESYDRVKRYRERYSNAQCNEDVAEGSSTSTSLSDSDSDSVSVSEEEEGVQGEEKPRPEQRAPVEMMVNPDVRVYTAVTGGRIPGLTQYRAVMKTVKFLREREKLDDKALACFLAPYWNAWLSRKRGNGQPYDPANISWLTEWALNKSIPPSREKKILSTKEKVDNFINRREE
jgi:hypothetical protein